MNYPSEFLNFLASNNIPFIDFICVVIGIFLAFYFLYHLPFGIFYIFTFFLVIFGFLTDKKRDKFLWHTNEYLYRTCLNLYDEYGYAKNTLYYKFVSKRYGGK